MAVTCQSGIQRDMVSGNVLDRLDKMDRQITRNTRTTRSWPSGGGGATGGGASGIPAGGIIMWSGAVEDIPEGWVLCDGDNDTPDLRNSFIVGAGDTYSVDDTGGNETIDWYHRHASGGYATDSDNHDHSFSDTSGGPSTTTDLGTAPGGSVKGDGTHTHYVSGTTGGDSHSHDVTGNSGYAGDATEDILPPYYALALIMKVAD